MKITVIGGAGFIGQHVVRKLMALNHNVAVVDNFIEQVHGPDKSITIVAGDHIINADLVDGSCGWKWISGQDAVIHLAASVGVGQSMYEITDYVDNNSLKTARLLSCLSNRHAPKRLIVASSMSIYGEGPTRWTKDVAIVPESVDESRPPDLRSIYALTKYDQEQLCLIWGRAYKVPTVALRFFNTYGPGQSLSNPYTGVMAIFASRLLNGKPPIIYEDGEQSRDFIHVDDVANAVVHAATTDMPSGAYNVGTGRRTPIKAVACAMAVHIAPHIAPHFTGKHREGDIRHCFADISKITATGWNPKVDFGIGIRDYCAWLKTQPIPEDKVEAAHGELEAHGLTR